MAEVSKEEFALHLPKLYTNPNWSIEGSGHAIPGVGTFPWFIHHTLERRVLSLKGWGKLFMCVAAKNIDNLAAIWAMGVDMSNRTRTYHTGQYLPKAEDFETSGRENLTRIKERIQEEAESSRKRKRAEDLAL